LNRTGLLERLQAAIAQRDGDSLVAVLCFDINRFKTINDTLGHRTGDGVLVTAAQRLSARLEPGESLARLGADQFAVVMPRMEHASQIARRAHYLLQGFVTPFTIANYPYSLSASAGISVFPTDAAEPEDLLRNADVAMHAAKADGRNAFQYYSAGLRQVAEQRFELERGLRRALESSEFSMQYQPLVDAETNSLEAVEALIRWDRGTRQTTFPDDFIPFAERTYLIHEIGDWVFRTVFAQVQQWCAAGYSLRTWLNVSAAQLDPKLPAKLESLLSQYRVDVDCIGLELTETALIGRSDEVLRILHDIKALGVRLALDDFGVKYSSLDYLQRLPIDVLKIDRIFVSGVNANSVNRAIIQAIIAVARELNFEVSAEGIETREEMETLKALGCDTLQGYFFTGAVPAKEITGFMLRGRTA
jgi:diguanylate cyclase (GGDEF)-like protein